MRRNPLIRQRTLTSVRGASSTQFGTLFRCYFLTQLGSLNAPDPGAYFGATSHASVYLRPVDLPTRRITARDRYSTNAATL